MNNLLLTVAQAGESLQCGRTQVFELIKTGRLESVTVGRLRRIPRSALEAYVEGLRREARQAA